MALVLKNIPANAGEVGSIPGLGRFAWRRKQQPTPVFLPEKSHVQRSLMDCSLWVKRESDITQSIQTHNTDSCLTIFWVYSKVMWYFHILYQGNFSIIDCVPCAVYYTVCCILYCQCEGQMCRSCSELCLQVIWITSPVTSLRTIHRVLLHPLEEDMDLANRHALPQNTDLFCFCKMIVYWASQHLAWNITFTINYIDIYTWSAGDTPVNCLFVHEFHGVFNSCTLYKFSSLSFPFF